MDEKTEVRPSGAERGAEPAVRFTPGTLIAGRFRIIAPLGRGGMGEVFRADDTTLGQQVALKFLPPHFAHDPDRLQRLYAEVRVGRQVSHPNVCRLYDVVEWEGSRFISMEYIDGEDLGSLLRRIGKLPPEKALELSRELCAGLAAAHALGIVHRDLKPANIMIDGRGRARVTDFGLAALERDLEQRREIAGTPAYMAPEQAAGGHASQRTDLYSLGLILHEIFTGRREPSSGASDVDPDVLRVILRCLERDPAARPPSVESVLAALPGGDALQAALDAGETPSPEMIAAAGATGELRPSRALPLLLIALLLIAAGAMLNQATELYSLVGLPKHPQTLADRARELAASFGQPPPADVRYTFVR
ncbi:MAG TPA: serine/threonine-protein kinase, partial [Thermoanaerobaculia bacterium]|nr:serine/threonine-protein kinase [Thermoanaerobaculia bacterium]